MCLKKVSGTVEGDGKGELALNLACQALVFLTLAERIPHADE